MKLIKSKILFDGVDEKENLLIGFEGDGTDSNQMKCDKCSGKLRLWNKWFYECTQCSTRQRTTIPFITREEAMKTHRTQRVGIVQ